MDGQVTNEADEKARMMEFGCRFSARTNIKGETRSVRLGFK